MCPECIGSMALAAASLASTGALSRLLVRGVARIAREGKMQESESKETIRHDHAPSGTPESRLAS
jgi:hypothetical protein